MTIAGRLFSTLGPALFAVAVCACSSSSAVPNAPATEESGSASGLSPATLRVQIKGFADLPGGSSGSYAPLGIASGPKDSLWVTDAIYYAIGKNAVVQIAPSGKPVNTFYYSSGPSPSLRGIVEGPDLALWIADFGDSQILHMTAGGTFTAYQLSAPPVNITVGPDKNLWFTEYGDGAVGKITTNGKFRVYPAGKAVEDIVAGPDGALWFTDTSGAIGRITTHGKVTHFTTGITGAPYDIAAGPDGALWFTESSGAIGRITTAGNVSEYSRDIEQPSGIAAGPDRAMWFTEYEVYESNDIRNSKIGRITMSGNITYYSKGLGGSAKPTRIVAGPDGNMWFDESGADRSGRAKL